MKITAGDAKLVGKNRTLLRFAVTFHDDEGPVHTVEGYLLTHDGDVYPPKTYTGTGRFPKQLVHDAPRLTDALKRALLESPRSRELAEIVLQEGASKELERAARAAEGVEVGEVVL